MVENTDGKVFAEKRRNNVDAQIDAVAVLFHQPAALLRAAALGDVHAGGCLEVVDQVPALLARDDGQWLDQAHEAQRNTSRGFVAQDKQIAGLLLNGLANDLFHRDVRLQIA